MTIVSSARCCKDQLTTGIVLVLSESMYVCINPLNPFLHILGMLRVPSSQCIGYSTPCQAITDGALNLVCPACQNQTGITWTHTNRSIKLERYNTFNITLQHNSGTIADGCYACTCLEQTKCQFSTEVKPSGK